MKNEKGEILDGLKIVCSFYFQSEIHYVADTNEYDLTGESKKVLSPTYSINVNTGVAFNSDFLVRENSVFFRGLKVFQIN